MSLMTEALQTVTLNHKNVTWNSQPEQLTCVIVEPRNHANLQGALYNMANVYANTDAGLTIFHSKNNETMVNDITKNWRGVTLFCLPKNNLTIQEYSYLLTESKTYESISSSHLLIFQTDSCIFKTIPGQYFEYDYVGAPWRHKVGNGCGNGGFSLRRRETMIKICKEHEFNRHPEDVYFAHVENLKIPPKELQRAFSVENIHHIDPVGCHKIMSRYLSSKLQSNNQT